MKPSPQHPRPHTPPEIPARHRPRELRILHEDRDVLVINKDAGLLTMSFRPDERRTAEEVLNHYLRKGNPRSAARVYLVHRLDRETSGLLVFAKSSRAQVRLKETWAETEKEYAAVVQGKLAEKSGILTTQLQEDEDQFVRVVDDPGKGRLAQTKYEVLWETPRASGLRVWLVTGRKNQIRVQFAHIGHPVLGDRKYGPASGGGRMALHARRLRFPHPHDGQPMEFEAPLPDFMVRMAPR